MGNSQGMTLNGMHFGSYTVTKTAIFPVGTIVIGYPKNENAQTGISYFYSIEVMNTISTSFIQHMRTIKMHERK